MKNLKNLTFGLIAIAVMLIMFGCSENSLNDKSADKHPGPDNTDVGYPADRLYTPNHQWVKIEGDSFALVGITTYPLPALGIIASVIDEPILGKTGWPKGKKVAELDGVSANKDILMPLFGLFEGDNPLLDNSPQLVNQDPYNAGWIFRISGWDPLEMLTLMTAEQYAAYVAGL